MLGSLDMGRLSSTEKRVSAATKPLIIDKRCQFLHLKRSWEGIHLPYRVSDQDDAYGRVLNCQRRGGMGLQVCDLVLQPFFKSLNTDS